MMSDPIQLHDLKHFLEVVQRIVYVLDVIDVDANHDAFPGSVEFAIHSKNGYRIGTVVWQGENGCEIHFDQYGEEI